LTTPSPLSPLSGGGKKIFLLKSTLKFQNENKIIEILPVLVLRELSFSRSKKSNPKKLTCSDLMVTNLRESLANKYSNESSKSFSDLSLY